MFYFLVVLFSNEKKIITVSEYSAIIKKSNATITAFRLVSFYIFCKPNRKQKHLSANGKWIWEAKGTTNVCVRIRTLPPLHQRRW